MIFCDGNRKKLHQQQHNTNKKIITITQQKPNYDEEREKVQKKMKKERQNEKRFDEYDDRNHQ